VRSITCTFVYAIGELIIQAIIYRLAGNFQFISIDLSAFVIPSYLHSGNCRATKKIIITDLWLAFHPTTDSGSWTQSQWELSNKSWVKNLLLVTSGFSFSANIIACVRNFFLPLRVGFYTAFRGY